MPDHSVVHRYARCLSYPEWGVGSVTGIYFTGAGDDVQQWARVKFSPGVRTVPAGSLQFVDFSKPDPGAERVQRFMTAAQHAMAEGDYPLAAKRLIFARDAEPTNAAVLRLMTLAFWQAGELSAAGRAVRDWARVEGDRPAPHRFAARIYEDMGAIDLAAEAADRAAARGPQDADAWERVGRLRLRLMDRAAAITRARDGAPPRPERRGPARPRARPPPRRRPRRRGHRHRAGDAAGARLGSRVGALRARARAHRSHLRRDRGGRARAWSSTATTARSPTSSSACARRYRACCPRRDRLGLRPRGARRAAGGRRAGRGARARRRVRRGALGGPARPRGAVGTARDPDRLRGRGLDRRSRARRGDALQRQGRARPRDGRMGDGRDPGRRQARSRVRRAAGAPAIGSPSRSAMRRTSACSSSASAPSDARWRRCSSRSTARSIGVARRARDGVHGTDELPALLPDADVVVNLLPLTEATRGSFGARELAAMREGALYVNAGRGATTDTGGAGRRAAGAGASAPCSTSSIPSRCPPTIRCGRRRA